MNIKYHTPPKEKAPEFLFECFRFSGQQYIFCRINSNSHFSFSCNSFDKYSHPGREHHSSPRSFFNNIAPHLGHLLLQNSPSCLVIVALSSFRLPIFDYPRLDKVQPGLALVIFVLVHWMLHSTLPQQSQPFHYLPCLVPRPLPSDRLLIFPS